MTTNKQVEDGGPAFPRPGHWPAGDGDPCERVPTITEPQDGMTLRDYFAAKAMQSIFTGPGARMVADRDDRYDGTNWAFVVATNAYDMADAMLAARKAGAK